MRRSMDMVSGMQMIQPHAFDGRKCCQPDAGVAGGGLDEHRVLIDDTLAQGGLQHTAGDAVAFTDPAGLKDSTFPTRRAFKPWLRS